MGSIPSNYAPFMKKNYSYALHKSHDQEELQGITHHYICTVIVFYIFYLTENCGRHDDTVTDSHIQSQARIGVLVYRSVQNTKSQVH